MKIFLPLLLCLSFGSKTLQAISITQFGFIQYDKNSFAKAYQPKTSKAFVNVNIPVPILDGDEKQSNLYVLGGIHYNFIRSNPLLLDDSLYLTGLFTHKIANIKELNFLFSYTFFGKYTFLPITHEFYVGFLNDFYLTKSFKLNYSIVRIQHTAHHFLMPSPTFQFEKIISDNWSFIFSLTVDFKLSFYSPILPSKAEFHYKTKKEKLILGLNFDDTIQSKTTLENKTTLWQSGSRGVLFIDYSRQVYQNFWLGGKTGLGLDMIKYFDENGKEIKVDSSKNRFFPFFVGLDFIYKT